MKTFKEFISENDGKKDYACVMAYITGPLEKEILDFSKNIKDDDIYTAPDDNYGREEDIHATILFGLHSNDPTKVKKLVSGYGSLKLTLGRVSLFSSKETGKEYEVLKIDIRSKDLKKLHNLLADKLPNTQTHSSYKPHATLAYMKKGKGEQYVGNTQFEGKEFVIDSVKFSTKDSENTLIDLV